jgi:acetyl esterase
MPLDPQARALLEVIAAVGTPDFATMTPQEVRALTQTPRAGDVEPVESVRDLAIPGPAGPIPVRVYTPGAASAGPRPGLVYFHGGGFVICDLDSHDAVCRSLANAAGCVIVSVDYRLAPDHRFPAAPEDCYAATRHVAERAAEFGVDADRLAVGGDSAGGNLAAVVALMARDRGGPDLRFQLLVYPMAGRDFEAESFRANGEGYLLTGGMLRWFWDLYLRDESDAANPWAVPLGAPDLSGLPAALVITAEYDPLRDDGEAYAARLQEAGVAVSLTRYDGMIHGFWSMGETIARSREAIREAAAALGSAWAD